MAQEKDPAFVKFQGIEKRFGKVVAVKKMDLDIPEGSFVTLLGPSGCGKTTLLRMLAGLENPTSGDIFIKGKRINDTPIHKRNLGMIFQNYALFPHKTIFDNVAFGLKYRDVPKANIREKVEKALETVRLPGVGNRMPSQLSGGQQQRIALARAIVIEPDVLLMDEPLSALDENLREDMRREIDNLQQELGVTTIFVTHDQREALSMSDKVVVMKDGFIQQEGVPEEVYNNSANHFVADFLGHSNFLNAVVEDRENDFLRVRLEDGSSALVTPSGDFASGEKAEIVIRAQKMKLEYSRNHNSEEKMNFFSGTVVDRSYMGGEVSYFVQLPGKQVLHVINFVKRSPYRRGDEVVITVDPYHCRLLKM
ncbi:polyamine transporter subunit; ATP-binding component of ABC superfamily [Desulfamplus magnetovallimortis]|uniref:Spermidine/putrescine import ATP-binding protein PotA n=1 Tax=Desulfamplus magnetovallimortis TaxID=1246637 RepID=A0A1W1H7M9_9BACT|nr:ABC transporter ATP-binding protein [Desulfamplus magnetovallimortis]SLM28469.1 polyamine transporter subunit; ATP-binding component of ABC superfamily [Desulfamplus magnetovallimortis]